MAPAAAAGRLSLVLEDCEACEGNVRHASALLTRNNNSSIDDCRSSPLIASHRRLSSLITTPSSLPNREVALAWVALLVAIVACSSGGIWFLLLNSTPPILRATWRLLFTALLQFPGFIVEYRALLLLKSPQADATLVRYRDSVKFLCLNGAVLAVHFAAWSLSLAYTSLPHSLLFVCTTPLLLVFASGMRYLILTMRARRISSAVSPDTEEAPADSTSSTYERVIISSETPRNSTPLPPTRLEVAGAVVGFVAAVLLALEAGLGSPASIATSNNNNNVQPTVGGDALATLGAAAMGVYLRVGQRYRKWLSLFLYVFPVTLASAGFSLLLSLAFEHDSIQLGGTSPTSLLGFLGAWDRLGIVFCSALFGGILGHTFANFAVPRVGALVVSVLLLWEPFFGSLMGYALGLDDPPGPLTYAAGIPLLLASCMVIIGSRGEEEGEEDGRKPFTSQAPSSDSTAWEEEGEGVELAPQ